MVKNRSLSPICFVIVILLRGILMLVAETMLITLFSFLASQENNTFQLLLALHSGYMTGSDRENVSRNNLCWIRLRPISAGVPLWLCSVLTVAMCWDGGNRTEVYCCDQGLWSMIEGEHFLTQMVAWVRNKLLLNMSLEL